MSNLEKLKACFRETLKLAAEAPVETLAYQQHPAWDSVAHMRLVVALESAFDIMLETDEILDLSDFAKAREILKKHDVVTDA